jgi:hypothetical protein
MRNYIADLVLGQFLAKKKSTRMTNFSFIVIFGVIAGANTFPTIDTTPPPMAVAKSEKKAEKVMLLSWEESSRKRYKSCKEAIADQASECVATEDVSVCGKWMKNAKVGCKHYLVRWTDRNPDWNKWQRKGEANVF